MPGKVDEAKWESAKQAAAKQGHAEDYAYISGIYKKMGGEFKSVPNKVRNNQLWKQAKQIAKRTSYRRKDDLDYILKIYKRLGGKITMKTKENAEQDMLNLVPFHAQEEFKSRTKGAKDKKKRKTREDALWEQHVIDYQNDMSANNQIGTPADMAEKFRKKMEAGDVWDHPRAQNKMQKEEISGARAAKKMGSTVLNPRGI